MGAIALCYSDAARDEYRKWRVVNQITDTGSEMPSAFPISDSVVKNEIWNKFGWQFWAKWVNEEAAAYREVDGKSE